MSDDADKPRTAMAVNIDADGKPVVLPYTTRQVDGIVRNALQTGDIVAAVMRIPDGSMAVQVLEPPSRQLLAAFESIAAAYRTLLRTN